jgi:diguanylate cyclase (GGDEF)-like protein
MRGLFSRRRTNDAPADRGAAPADDVGPSGLLEAGMGSGSGPTEGAAGAPIEPPPPVAAAPSGPADGALVASEALDPLTGLARREALLGHLAEMDGKAAALILFDMDDFRRYNEQWGRQAGDDALRAIGATLAAAVGDRGRVFRSGGDQFAAVLETGLDQNSSASAWADQALAGLSPLSASGAVVVLRQGNRPEATVRDGELTLVALKEAGGAMVGTHGPHVDAWARSRRHEVDALARRVEDLQMENERLNQSMLIDTHTGLANASAFDADHSQLDYRRRRSDDPYAVVLIELDHFDQLCSALGDEAGAQALKEVAATVARTIRGSDRAYTMGGNELAVLLPGAQVREAVVAAERIRLRVEKLGRPHPDNPSGIVTVTLAAVAAGFRHKTTKDVMAEIHDLLHNGTVKNRNRVIWPL